MICQDCKHPNPDDNRFCGKCGALLATANKAARPVQNGSPAGSLEPANVGRSANERSQSRPEVYPKPIVETRPWRVQGTPSRESTEPRAAHSTGVSGPSFLGLNDASADYGDDLYRSNWGGRVAIAFIVLLVAGGLAFLQWRSNQQQPARPSTVPVAAPEQAPGNSASDSQMSGQSAGAPSSNSAQNASPPQANAQATAPGTQPANAASSGTPNATSNATSNETPNAASSATGQAQPADSSSASAQLPNWPGTTGTESAGDGSKRASSESKSELGIPESDEGESDQSQTQEQKSAAPPAAVRARREEAGGGRDAEANTQDQVRWAETYLEGKGVPQNCDEGIGILRAAEARGNIPALVKLGALYATGSCVPLSRVSAYHYFTRAYRLQPRNQSLDHNRVMLWGDMSESEKEQAANQDGPLQ